MTRKEIYQERREKLCKLSAKFRQEREDLINNAKTDAEALHLASKTLNSFIVEHYKTELGEGDFLTFHQWKEKNRTIKKGEKGHPIWGQPLDEQRRRKGEEPTDDEFIYFPLCYLFHESQTVEMTEREKKALTPKINAFA